jgi:hypothetical protein
VQSGGAGGGEPSDQEAAYSRCVLLAWRDTENQYKLQARPYMGEDRSPAEWVDHEQMQPRPLPGRKTGVYIVTGLQYARAEFRLVNRQAEIDDKHLATWFSAVSEPGVTVVDPPTRAACRAFPRSDHDNIGVVLHFGSTDPGYAQEAHRDPEISEDGPWAAWPGLAVCQVQARWRYIRRALDDGIADAESEAAARQRIPSSVLDGDWQKGPLCEVGRSTCPFDLNTGTWSCIVGDVPHGLVVRFEVRMGTAYRWSHWSEESNEVQVVVSAPKPQGRIEVARIGDSDATLRWLPFELAKGLELCEYRVRVCQLDPGKSEHTWSDESAHTVGIFSRTTSEGLAQYEVKALTADRLYAVRVDARYPFVGDRGWSTPCEPNAPLLAQFHATAPAGGATPVAQRRGGNANAGARRRHRFYIPGRPTVACALGREFISQGLQHRVDFERTAFCPDNKCIVRI